MNSKDSESLPSIPKGERWESLDLIRGCAVLGIFVMNIQAFAMPDAAYFNPTAYGDLNGGNYGVWLVSHLFFDSKFMAIFSILFGAGIVLFTERAVKRERSPFWGHVRRNGLLILFGFLHAHLLWSGDILFSYGVCALLMYPFRRLSAKALLRWSFGLLLVGSLISVSGGLSFQQWPAADQQEMVDFWNPGEEAIAEAVAIHQGTFTQWQPKMSEDSWLMQLVYLPQSIVWRVTGLMLLGMALFKSGFLLGRGAKQTAKNLFILGSFIGLAMVTWGVWENEQIGFNPVETSFFLLSQWNYWGSLALALAYIGAILLWFGSPALEGLKNRLMACGRMAFTLYILQTLLAILVFRGTGLGWFGETSRMGQAGVVLGVWAVMLTLAPLWLSRFSFGPLEWLWRCLTYGKILPIRKDA